MNIDLELARLGARIRNRREALGLSVADVARKSGFDEQTISRLETGAGGRLHTLLCVMYVLEVKVKMRQIRVLEIRPQNSTAETRTYSELHRKTG